jgi:hypothetical protein
MLRQLVQHMVKKAYTGGDLVLAGTVEIDRHADVGFVGLPADIGFPADNVPLGPALTFDSNPARREGHLRLSSANADH